MNYDNIPLPKLKTIDVLETSDILTIVLKDLERYGVPAEEWGAICRDHIYPLCDATDKLKRKYIFGEKQGM